MVPAFEEVREVTESPHPRFKRFRLGLGQVGEGVRSAGREVGVGREVGRGGHPDAFAITLRPEFKTPDLILKYSR